MTALHKKVKWEEIHLSIITKEISQSVIISNNWMIKLIIQLLMIKSMESGRGQHPSSTLGINLDISHNFCPLVESGIFF